MLSLLSVSILIRWLHLGYPHVLLHFIHGPKFALILVLSLELATPLEWLIVTDSIGNNTTRIYLVQLSTKMLLTKILKCQPNTAMCHHHYRRKRSLPESRHTLRRTHGFLKSWLRLLPCSPPIIFPVR